jgi:hypothetical protein
VPVVNIVVSYDGKVLLVERSQELSNYPGLWNGISGYLDDHKDLTIVRNYDIHHRNPSGIR